MERREAEAIYNSGREAVVEALMRMDRELRERRAESPGDRASSPAGRPLELPGRHAPQAGDDLRFEIAIGPGEPPLRDEGRVTRLGQDGRTAIAFGHISAIDRQRLGRFISDCRLQEGFGRG